MSTKLKGLSARAGRKADGGESGTKRWAYEDSPAKQRTLIRQLEVRALDFLTEIAGDALISTDSGASLREIQGCALENAASRLPTRPFPQVAENCESRRKCVPLNFTQGHHRITTKRVRTLEFPSGIQGCALRGVLTCKEKRCTTAEQLPAVSVSYAAQSTCFNE